MEGTAANVNETNTWYFSSVQTVSKTAPFLDVGDVDAYHLRPPIPLQDTMDDRIYRVFGSRLRELREQKSVTQEELARRVDLSRTSITNIEKGRQRVMLHQMVELAEALDADPLSLLPVGEALHEPPVREDVARVVEALRKERDDPS